MVGEFNVLAKVKSEMAPLSAFPRLLDCHSSRLWWNHTEGPGCGFERSGWPSAASFVLPVSEVSLVVA
jgi:hypothetical protein